MGKGGGLAAAFGLALAIGASGSVSAQEDDAAAPMAGHVAHDSAAVEEAARAAAEILRAREAAAVGERLRAQVAGELAGYFDLFLYVSKAPRGPWAQRMFVFTRGGDGEFAFEESFPVSTGRERQEKYFTWTPPGLFKLDPDRFYRMARSAKWNNAPMPWAMFLDYAYRSGPSGVALHAAVGRDIGKLGNRASGGCIRLPPERAEALFRRIREEHRGPVPVFAFDEARGTTSRSGELRRDSAGMPLFAGGFTVLLVVDDYRGEELTAGAGPSLAP